MESLSVGFSSSLPLQNHPKTHKTIPQSIPFLQISSSISNSFNSDQTQILFPKKIPRPTQTESGIGQLRVIPKSHSSNLFQSEFPVLEIRSFFQVYLKSQLSILCMGLSFPLCSIASDTVVPAEEVPNKINLEAIVVSVDDFFNRNPFFVAGVTFIWLVVIPLTQEFLRKYKFISAIDAFRKLRDDPNAQLLDIRDKKTLQYLGSPNLKILNKSVLQVEFSEGDEGGFVKKVKEKFVEPANTIVCILDNFDGNSMKVAELLYGSGFKEAYAIRGGVRGKKGWQAIQETLLPPSVHIYPKKKAKVSQQPDMNEGVIKQSNNQAASATTSPLGQTEKVVNGYVNSVAQSTPQPRDGSRSLSPYPNYPDMKPPSSPTPSKP